ncbi:MAG: YggT family protein [Clostridia bacterium]|nr:YggT family protein [Clostridia bacterium]
MHIAVALLVGTVSALLTFLKLCFFVRAVLSFLPVDEQNPITRFTALVTEPVIVPVRALCDRFGWFQNSVLDVPFFIAFLVISAISMFV